MPSIQNGYTDDDRKAAAAAVSQSQWEGFVAAQRRERIESPNERYAAAVLNAVAPAIAARAKAEALRERGVI